MAIHTAIGDLAGLRDRAVIALVAVNLPAIRAATAKVDMKGALINGRLHLDHALNRIAMMAAGGPCACGAYVGYLYARPEREADRGHIVIDDGTVFRAEGDSDYRCHRADRGRVFTVREQTGGHVPFYEWSLAH